MRPLSGIKIIELTSALSGPYCAMLLGDLGAEIIKIEEPKAGDMLRKSGPFIEGEGCYFLYGNRNKRSMTLNLQSERGRNILLKLVKNADVFVWSRSKWPLKSPPPPFTKGRGTISPLWLKGGRGDFSEECAFKPRFENTSPNF